MTSHPPSLHGPSTSVQEFRTLLLQNRIYGKVLALCGAGLSAASGLDTFRGKGGMWRRYRATDLATPEAFEEDPGLVWLFYSYRRHKALQANPNPGHYALAELARKMPGFMCLTQNVDGLSQRALHPPNQLKLLHGSLFNITCFESCDYVERDNYRDPFDPLFDIASSPGFSEGDGLSKASKSNPDKGDDGDAGESGEREVDENSPKINPSLLPKCPQCKTGLLRPGVVWFGEPLPADTLTEIDDWITHAPSIALLLVIGTSAAVFPAASYIAIARRKGARIAVINLESSDNELGAAGGLGPRDFLFQGDAGEILPVILGGLPDLNLDPTRELECLGNWDSD